MLLRRTGRSVFGGVLLSLSLTAMASGCSRPPPPTGLDIPRGEAPEGWPAILVSTAGRAPALYAGSDDAAPAFGHLGDGVRVRVEGAIQGQRVPVTVGGVDLPAGTTVMLVNAAANRDPARFPDPDTFDPHRDNARSHVTFGRGVHTCPGAPLARTEAIVGLNRLLDRTSDITIDEEHHGPPDARRYQYVPTFILRGLTRLHMRFTP